MQNRELQISNSTDFSTKFQISLEQKSKQKNPNWYMIKLTFTHYGYSAMNTTSVIRYDVSGKDNLISTVMIWSNKANSQGCKRHASNSSILFVL